MQTTANRPVLRTLKRFSKRWLNAFLRAIYFIENSSLWCVKLKVHSNISFEFCGIFLRKKLYVWHENEFENFKSKQMAGIQPTIYKSQQWWVQYVLIDVSFNERWDPIGSLFLFISVWFSQFVYSNTKLHPIVSFHFVSSVSRDFSKEIR